MERKEPQDGFQCQKRHVSGYEQLGNATNVRYLLYAFPFFTYEITSTFQIFF